MRQLHLEYDGAPSLIYVFYQDDQGFINNFSINIQHARQRNHKPMTAAQLADLMHGQYPATRGGRLLGIEHPRQGLTRWMDTAEVCQRLHTTRRSLHRWAAAGLVHPSQLGHRNYYDAAEIEALFQSNILQDNGRIDKTGRKNEECRM